jgi:hypothetical protein
MEKVDKEPVTVGLSYPSLIPPYIITLPFNNS